MSEDLENVEAADAPQSPSDGAAAPETPVGQSLPAAVPARGRARRWIVNILLGTLIFSCGAVTGGGVVARAAWNRVTTALQYPEQAPERAVRHLTRVLRLDKGQSAEVETIFKRRAKAIAEARREIAPRIDAELQAIRDEVSAVLRPEQAKRWLRIYEELRPKVFPKGGSALIREGQGR